MAFLNQKVTTGAVDYPTLIGAGIVKYFEERALAPFVGNGTLLSGAVKGAAGFVAHKYGGGGIVGNSVALGFTVDAVEDGLTAVIGPLLGNVFGGGQAGNENW